MLKRIAGMIRKYRSLLVCLCLAGALTAGGPAAGQADQEPTLEVLLARTGRAVGLFWRQLSSVTCTEAITQEKIEKRGKVEARRNSQFDYLILIKFQGDDVAIEESRLVRKGKNKPLDLPLLTTSGFQTLALIFHPAYQSSYRYEWDGEQVSAGQRLIRVRFEHLPGTRSTSALALQGHIHPLDLCGTAWIDPDKGIIHSMIAELKAPMGGINLHALYTKVEYMPQRFSSMSESLWLPSRATVDVETAQQHWRNVHLYSDYRRFTVKSEGTVVK